MAYELFYERDAKGEVTFLKDTYGQSLVKAYDEWTNALAAQADSNQELSGAANLEKILEDLLTEELPSDLRTTWARFKSAPLIDKCRAIIAAIRNRRPPWRAVVVERHDLPGLDSRIMVAVRLYLSIDDVKKNLVVRMAEQLPS
jgi:hypothetical protein